MTFTFTFTGLEHSGAGWQRPATAWGSCLPRSGDKNNTARYVANGPVSVQCEDHSDHVRTCCGKSTAGWIIRRDELNIAKCYSKTVHTCESLSDFKRAHGLRVLLNTRWKLYCVKERTSRAKWGLSEVTWTVVMWRDLCEVILFWSEVKWVTVKFLDTKLPCTLRWLYAEGTGLFCDCFIWCVSCIVVVLTCFVMCGCVCVFFNKYLFTTCSITW